MLKKDICKRILESYEKNEGSYYYVYHNFLIGYLRKDSLLYSLKLRRNLSIEIKVYKVYKGIDLIVSDIFYIRRFTNKELFYKIKDIIVEKQFSIRDNIV